MVDPVVAPVVAPAPVVEPVVAPVVALAPTELGAPADPKAIDPPKTELGKPADPPKPADPAVAFDAAKLTLPEGMKADDPQFKSFSEIYSDVKLDPQAKGQKLIDLYTTAVKGIQQQQVDVWKTTNEGWVAAVKADPEIGGAKFEPTKTSIARAIDSLGPELSVAFRQGLDATGAGNHPAIWKGLAKMAALLTEGGHVSGSPASGKPDLATAFFPNSKMT
jgi:hypothetical protein